MRVAANQQIGRFRERRELWIMAEEYPESFPFQKKAAAEGGQVSQGRLRELFSGKSCECCLSGGEPAGSQKPVIRISCNGRQGGKSLKLPENTGRVRAFGEKITQQYEFLYMILSAILQHRF